MPHNAAGMRMEPEVSVPSEAMVKSAATAAPEPPLEPPAILSVFHGLLDAPECGVSLVMPYAYSCIFRLPLKIAPARVRLSTTDASYSGVKSFSHFEP